MRIRKSIERWFPVTGDPDGAQIKIKHLTPGEIQDIVDVAIVQEIEYRPDPKNPAGNPIPVMRSTNNRRKDREETVVACVKGWKKFFDANDKPLAFNLKNIRRAIREIDGFVQFVNECRERLGADLEMEKGEQEKNSPNT